MTYVEEISRQWQYASDGAGDIMLVLVAVEIVYYLVKTVIAVWKWVKGGRRLVREERNEWRSYRRQRVLATYRPETEGPLSLRERARVRAGGSGVGPANDMCVHRPIDHHQPN